ncbi:MAG: hypothetical protein R3E96_12390 [Planctomycetota bacterium]
MVETVVDLSAYSINANGFFVAAEATFTLGVADVLLPGANDLNFENSDNVTHLLVTGFTGADGDDLDTNDDGILDTTPWASIVDSVAFIETPGTGDMVYSTNQVGPDGAFVPGLVFTCSGVWTIGQFDPSLGEDTPGAANLCGTTNMSTFCDPANNNSTGAPVVLSGSMGSGVGSGPHLEATGGPTSEFGYVLVGTAPETVAPLAISDGLLCLSTAAPLQLGRYNIVGTDELGRLLRRLRRAARIWSAPPPSVAATTWPPPCPDRHPDHHGRRNLALPTVVPRRRRRHRPQQLLQRPVGDLLGSPPKALAGRFCQAQERPIRLE